MNWVNYVTLACTVVCALCAVIGCFKVAEICRITNIITNTQNIGSFVAKQVINDEAFIKKTSIGSV